MSLHFTEHLSKRPWEMYCLPLEQKAVSLNSELLSCNKAACADAVWPFMCLPVGNGVPGIRAICADTLATAIVVSNKLSFISDPRVSYLLPVSVELRQTNLLVCKLVDNSSDFSQFLRIERQNGSITCPESFGQ